MEIKMNGSSNGFENNDNKIEDMPVIPEAEDSPVEESVPEVKDTETPKLRIYRAIAVILALVSATVGALSILLSFDGQSRYLESSAVTALLWVCIAVGVVFAFSSLFVFKSGHNATVDVSASPLRFWGILPTLIALTFPVIIFAGAHSNAFKAVAAVVCVMCVIRQLSDLLRLSPNFKLICCYSEILVAIFIISSLYVDLTIEMNSPFKLLVQFGAAVIMLDTVCDCHGIIGAVSPKTHVGTKCAVCTLGLVVGAVMCAMFFTHRELILCRQSRRLGNISVSHKYFRQRSYII